MITTIIISVLVGFAIGTISGIAAYECPKCNCNCDCNKKQLLKG
jgi:hypothetical protein